MDPRRVGVLLPKSSVPSGYSPSQRPPLETGVSCPTTQAAEATAAEATKRPAPLVSFEHSLPFVCLIVDVVVLAGIDGLALKGSPLYLVRGRGVVGRVLAKLVDRHTVVIFAIILILVGEGCHYGYHSKNKDDDQHPAMAHQSRQVGQDTCKQATYLAINFFLDQI